MRLATLISLLLFMADPVASFWGIARDTPSTLLRYTRNIIDGMLTNKGLISSRAREEKMKAEPTLRVVLPNLRVEKAAF